MGARQQGGFQARRYPDSTYQIKLESEPDVAYSDILAASSLSFDQAAATPVTTPTLNSGTDTTQGSDQPITATVDIYLAEDDPGQERIQHAFDTKSRVSLRIASAGKRIGAAQTLASTATIAIAADGTVAFAGNAHENVEAALLSVAQRGRILVIDGKLYAIRNVLYSAGSPSGLVIGRGRVETDYNAIFPFVGTAIAAIDSGSAYIIDGRSINRVFTGRVSSAPLPSATAAEDDSGFFTASVGFNFDPTFARTYTIPSAS